MQRRGQLRVPYPAGLREWRSRRRHVQDQCGDPSGGDQFEIDLIEQAEVQAIRGVSWKIRVPRCRRVIQSKYSLALESRNRLSSPACHIFLRSKSADTSRKTKTKQKQYSSYDATPRS